MWYGYEIKVIGKEKDRYWVFVDNNEPTIGSNRPCGKCQEYITKEGHDACLGTLPGVMNACCGHGVVAEAYVQMPNGNIKRGKDAIKLIKKLKLRASGAV